MLVDWWKLEAEEGMKKEVKSGERKRMVEKTEEVEDGDGSSDEKKKRE